VNVIRGVTAAVGTQEFIMATATPKPRLSRAETETRVASPLHHLRGVIRMYVSAEGVAAAVLFLAVCFWLGLAFDYGIFKITGLDWIQILHWGFRGVVLLLAVVALIGLVAYMVVSRLFYEFRASALALVLERRFPKLLGDRLITAVELADSKKAATYGYSQAMIDHTIQEAAELVAKAPVKDVFNWGRLVRYGVATVLVTVGAYFLLGAVYCGAQAAFSSQPDNFGTFASRFNQVSGIWFERNVLLRDVPWPRRAMLVFNDFPEDERRIGRDAPPVALTVQAFKWVIADPSKPEGWRPLVWSDVAGLTGATPTLAEAGIPDRLVDARFDGATVDDVEVFLAAEEAPTSSGAAQARETLAKLDALADSVTMQRKLRKLEVPDEVRLNYKGGRGSAINSMQAMEPIANHRFMATLPELKEDIRFWATGVDYSTPKKSIRVVPPPELTQLTRDEWHAAYLYYRLLGRTASTEALKGKRQEIRNQPVSLSGDSCRLDVPLGTDLELTGHLSVFEDQKNLDDKVALAAMKQVRIKPIAGVKEGHPIEIIDARTFKVRFPSVTTTLDFAFEFTDANNVTGFRHVVIKPVEDAAPEVDVQVEVVRKTANGYLVTPIARVPFSGKVKDDRGIAHAQYGYSLARLDVQPSAPQLAMFMSRVVGWGAGGLSPAVTGLAREQLTGRSEEQDSPPAPAPLKTFDAAIGDKDRFAIAVAALDKFLTEVPPDRQTRDQRFLKEFTLHPEEEYFELEKLALKSLNESDLQPRYRVRIWVEAQDTNVETGPGKGQSKEKFTLLVVSENELLSEIGKEEEGLGVKLEDAVNRLKDARLKLDKVQNDLPSLNVEELKPVSRWTVDTGEVGETLTKAGDTTREILSDYRRILAELKTNQVQKGMINRVNDRIVEPLMAAVDRDFPRAEESNRVFLKNLKAGQKDIAGAQKSMADLQAVLDRLTGVLESMEQLKGLNDLIKALVEIEKAEALAAEAIRRQYEKKVKEALDDLTK
jgi:hypothetical protein